ncbi:hypothetical protein INT08_10720 [Prosthecochloris sp. N3]|uniref:Lipid/polyisoprenoid-binding YceI-like domain-containing protein n=1 Tax=Prosthecochloris ethylica TaxID=2743976 RepID=A0ABR9XUU0_9CHLB|nr:MULTISPECIES: hypothetical protein [Prosthecochloris]MBF0587130.1 hypothetical protein [Prosthecochloris ethylica]MBF0637642.1 hypothetical protein [Prosthecochloris ethylica]NUK48072.1 hypothetical protein [Prosthecochloris ethylica]RNA64858.1 hypothetical protein CR163_006205 [Prosthecochloris sp. ZM_2]
MMNAQEHNTYSGSRASALLLFLFTLFCSTPASADPSVTIINKKISLDDIRLFETGLPGSGGMAVNEGPVDLDISPYGTAVDAVTMHPRQSILQTTVIRRIPDLWEWKALKNKHEDRPDVSVEYILRGGNGEQNVFSNTIDPSSTITVTVRPLANTVTEKNNQWIFGGGVELELDFAEIRKSGNYEGSIEIRITTHPLK